MLVQGWKYDTELAAQNAAEEIDVAMGLPIAGDVTRNFINVDIAEFNTPIFWFIDYHPEIEPILGPSTSFEVIEQYL